MLDREGEMGGLLSVPTGAILNSIMLIQGVPQRSITKYLEIPIYARQSLPANARGDRNATFSSWHCLCFQRHECGTVTSDPLF